MNVFLYGGDNGAQKLIGHIHRALKIAFCEVRIPHFSFPVEEDVGSILKEINTDIVIIVGFSDSLLELEKEILIVSSAIENSIPVFVVEYAIRSSIYGKVKRIASEIDIVFVSLPQLEHTASSFGYTNSRYLGKLNTPNKLEETSRKIVEVIEEDSFIKR